jgi:hypothetical protein
MLMRRRHSEREKKSDAPPSGIWDGLRGREREKKRKENTTQAESQSESTTQSKSDVKREHIPGDRKKIKIARGIN